MHYTSLLHAEQIISELLDSIIETAAFPLKVCQLKCDNGFAYVDNLIDAFLLAAKKPKAVGRVYNIGDGFGLAKCVRMKSSSKFIHLT